MRFLVVSHAAHFAREGKWYSYGPLVKEMVLWEKCVDQMEIFAPVVPSNEDAINLPYRADSTFVNESPSLDFTSLGEAAKSAVKLPWIVVKMWVAMWSADHIHLRCPGNLALVGCLLQVFFPWKKKTVKYAGNWDAKSAQPKTYKLQQWIINQPWLSRNMTVLVYGDWAHSSSNVRPFFTASYQEADFAPVEKSPVSEGIKLVYVGGLVSGKNPMVSLQALKLLVDAGHDARLVFCGEGAERKALEAFVALHGLDSRVLLRGNVSAQEVKQELVEAHFLVFLSDSEGWPKVVAEAMSWSCIPITTAVSCVPEMVGRGRRGVLVDKEPTQIVEAILAINRHPQKLRQMQEEARDWARQFTLERFAAEIEKLV